MTYSDLVSKILDQRKFCLIKRCQPVYLFCSPDAYKLLKDFWYKHFSTDFDCVFGLKCCEVISLENFDFYLGVFNSEE